MSVEAVDSGKTEVIDLGEKQRVKLKTKDLGSEDFMKLLLTQLQYQDPFEPVESTEFVSQLANFSFLANSTEHSSLLNEINVQIGELNDSIKTFLARQTKNETS